MDRREGKVIGFIGRTVLRCASNVVYSATGCYPGTGDHIRLELSTDFSERCDIILAFQLDLHSSPHLPWKYRQREAASGAD